VVIDWPEAIDLQGMGQHSFSCECDWPKGILQKSIAKTANHSSKPPFCILFYSKYFRRFAE
jgi:hypothetical protein